MYSTKISITEANMQGSFDTSNVHIYKKQSQTLEDAHNIEDILWQAVEIEGLDDSECYVEVDIEQDGEYVDHDECQFRSNIVRTNIPSRYVMHSGKTLHIFQIDRAKSSIQII